MPRYSLIIATLHDQGDLALCLASLASQVDAPDFEVIIVDQNGDDRLVSLVETYADRLALVHLQVDFRNACRARNLGASQARGEWLGFPDDDCQLLPTTLSALAATAADPSIGVITGRTVDAAGAANVLRWRAEPMSFDRRRMFGCLTEATLFVRRELFFAAGGFDERFGPGTRFPAAEGVDLMNRLFDHMPGYSAHYNPLVTMQHPTKIPPWNRWAARRFHEYAIGDGALIAKSPSPHMFNWGARTLVAAGLQVLRFNGWQSLAFAARIAGLVRGYARYQLARLK